MRRDNQQNYLWSIIGGSLGNIIEWYDFGLFIYLANTFSHLFFPTSDKLAGNLAVFGIFALGFLCRPIGAIILGHLGDKIGRSATLRLSILLITIPTLLVGLLPTYQKIGFYAPLLLIILRLIQGICIGGEYAGVMIYLTELAPANSRAFTASFAATGANIGILLATIATWIVTFFISAQHLIAWGWRLPFIVGGIIGLIILYFRLRLQETKPFLHLQTTQQITRLPVILALKKYPLLMLKIIGLTWLGAALYYITFTFLNRYLTQISNISLATVLQLQSWFVLAMLMLVPMAGKICDWTGRRRMYLLFSSIMLLCAFPCFWLLKSGNLTAIVIAMSLLTLLSSLEQGVTLATVVENVPLQARYTVIAIAYNISNTLFGGITPLLLTSLFALTHNPLVPAYYLFIAALVTGSVVWFSLPETKAVALNR